MAGWLEQVSDDSEMCRYARGSKLHGGLIQNLRLLGCGDRGLWPYGTLLKQPEKLASSRTCKIGASAPRVRIIEKLVMYV